MSGETNRLLGLAHQLSEIPDEREMDVVASTGEQVTAACSRMAIQHRRRQGARRCSATRSASSPTARSPGRASRPSTARAVHKALARGKIAVVAGFQGVDEDGNITTLGRGGSDTTAVAIAAALKADVCEIYTDVDGVYTTDPNIVPDARKIDRISYEEMLELASLGAKVLQIRRVEMAMKYGVPVHVRSSFNDNGGPGWCRGESDGGVVVSGVTATATRPRSRCRRPRHARASRPQRLRPLADGRHRRRHDHPEHVARRADRPDLHGARGRPRPRA